MRSSSHGALRGLQARGWKLEVDSNIQSVAKRVSSDLTAVLDFEPGWYPGGETGDLGEQTLQRVRMIGAETKLGELPPIAFSEPVFDLERIVTEA